MKEFGIGAISWRDRTSMSGNDEGVVRPENSCDEKASTSIGEQPQLKVTM